MHELIERVLISEEQIKTRIAQMAKELEAEYKDKNPLFVGLLKGVVVFFADMFRAVQIICLLVRRSPIRTARLTIRMFSYRVVTLRREMPPVKPQMLFRQRMARIKCTTKALSRQAVHMLQEIHGSIPRMAISFMSTTVRTGLHLIFLAEKRSKTLQSITPKSPTLMQERFRLVN